ncbi:diguanylate cyclase [Enterocloster sp. OA13]|uniref:sensor domain-containing diguanylate cyclase n=1 Tax=Enterocloster sp. OA13 TaxID=2914161 RepID=UPI0004729936|nr:diguanylate cyclase [Enterocloster sp. OA13]
MKKMIRKRLCIVILTAMLFSLFINYYVQTLNARNDMYRDAQDKFWQVGQILDQNGREAEKEKENLKERCFIRAKAIAYIIQDRPEVVGNQEEIAKITKLLQVDEFHLFDPEGNLYAGSEPRYFGLNFSSGEQMQFFLPMLEDYSLQMCQDITPNTAEGKLMQYAAVWREDHKGIVQVGLEPTTVLESMKKTELSYVFSLVTSEKDSTIYAIDPESHLILGSTDDSLVGKQIQDIGIRPEQLGITDKVARMTVNQEESYGVFARRQSVILGITMSEAALYQKVNRSTFLVALYLTGISLIMIAFISNYIDRYVVDGISSIHDKLARITKGNLDTRVAVDSTPEFKQLSSQINQMVESLLDTTNKISHILEMTKIPMGVYEYNRDMKRVMATSRLAEILMLGEKEAGMLFSDYILFEEKLEQIRRHPLEQEGGVYELQGKETRFIRIEAFERGHSTLGMIVDVTNDILEKRKIKQERDVDLLTGLYSRRAFYSKLEGLFADPHGLEHAMMLMADADNLKQVNDRYGHENGDRYLASIADILKSCSWDKGIAARLSGDEFALFLYGGSSRESLVGCVDRMLGSMKESRVELDSHVLIPVRFSAGYSLYPEDGTESAVLLRKADEAMYEAKKGRVSAADDGGAADA